MAAPVLRGMGLGEEEGESFFSWPGGFRVEKGGEEGGLARGNLSGGRWLGSGHGEAMEQLRGGESGPGDSWGE